MCLHRSHDPGVTIERKMVKERVLIFKKMCICANKCQIHTGMALFLLLFHCGIFIALDYSQCSNL